MIFGIVIGIILTIFICGIVFYLDNKSSNLDSDFQKSQSKILQELKEKKDSFEKEITQEQLEKKAQLNAELAQIEQKQKIKEQDYQNNILQLEQDYNERRAALAKIEATQDAERLQQSQEKINAQAEKYQEALNKLNQDYKDKTEQLDNDFFQYSEQINSRRAALTKEIQEYEEKQQKIIARFREDEEKRQQADFYRIKISDAEKKDIVQLKQLALNFSKPNVIYKLLYEVYYKTKLEELFKRILGDNATKGGIYKITNINNQKIYIGRTTKYIDRFRTHSKRGCNIDRINGQLYDAMFEEGLENFTWEIVEVCSKEEQSEKEKYWISFYKSDEYGYNGNRGG